MLIGIGKGDEAQINKKPLTLERTRADTASTMNYLSGDQEALHFGDNFGSDPRLEVAIVL